MTFGIGVQLVIVSYLPDQGFLSIGILTIVSLLYPRLLTNSNTKFYYVSFLRISCSLWSFLSSFLSGCSKFAVVNGEKFSSFRYNNNPEYTLTYFLIHSYFLFITSPSLNHSYCDDATLLLISNASRVDCELQIIESIFVHLD